MDPILVFHTYLYNHCRHDDQWTQYLCFIFTCITTVGIISNGPNICVLYLLYNHCRHVIPQWSHWEDNIGLVNNVQTLISELFHRDARLMPRRQVGSHMTTRCSVIGPFEICDPEITYVHQDECLHFHASPDHPHLKSSLYDWFLAFNLAK